MIFSINSLGIILKMYLSAIIVYRVGPEFDKQNNIDAHSVTIQGGV